MGTWLLIDNLFVEKASWNGEVLSECFITFLIVIHSIQVSKEFTKNCRTQEIWERSKSNLQYKLLLPHLNILQQWALETDHKEKNISNERLSLKIDSLLNILKVKRFKRDILHIKISLINFKVQNENLCSKQ